MAINAREKTGESHSDGEALPGGGGMAIVAPLIIGCAVVLAGLILLESHVSKQRVSELARVEEEMRRDLREAYRCLRGFQPREALSFTAAASEKLTRLNPGWRTHFAELRTARLMAEAEAEFMLDSAKNAAAVEHKFSDAMDLMTHASGELWQYGIMGRARARLEMGKHKDAEADLTLLMDRNPNFGAAYYWRSIARAKMGDATGAAADEAWARRLGSWPPIRDFMAEPADRRGDVLFRAWSRRD